MGELGLTFAYISSRKDFIGREFAMKFAICDYCFCQQFCKGKLPDKCKRLFDETSACPKFVKFKAN